MGPEPSRLSAADERFGHQLVAPATETLYGDPAWAERNYFLLHTEDGVVLNAGRQLYPHAGRRAAFSSASLGSQQIGYRFLEDFGYGDDPDVPAVGKISIEAVRPLERVRLVLDAPGGLLEYDLEFIARFPAVASERNRIEQDGRVVTDYMNFFQSGWYSGHLRLDDREYAIEARAGFRDRGWGLRKHEGAPRRGLVVFVGCELEAGMLYLLIYETASQRRVFTNGWLVDETGSLDKVTGVEHDLQFADGLLSGGAMALSFARSGTSELLITARHHLLLSASGYRAEQAEQEPPERLDQADPVTARRYAGQTDYGCSFVLDGQDGHGYVEVGLGTHERYRP